MRTQPTFQDIVSCEGSRRFVAKMVLAWGLVGAPTHTLPSPSSGIVQSSSPRTKNENVCMKDFDPRILRFVMSCLAVGVLDTLVTGSLIDWIPLIAGLIVGVVVARAINK